jgi:fengycin family lipopeptide synthetase B
VNTSGEAILVVGEESFTRSELTAETTKIRKSLDDLAARLGDDAFIPMIVDNSMDSHTALLAAAEMGLNVAAIDSTVKTAPLAKILENFDSPIVVIANPLMKVREFPEHKEFIPLQRAPVVADDDGTKPSRNGSVIVFSSGSTSDPKGVVLRWEDMVAWTILRHRIAEETMKSHTTILNLSPVSWALGLLNLLAVIVGARLITLDTSRFTPRQLLAEIQRVQPHYVSIPVNLAQILSSPAKAWKSEPVESIQELMIGSGKVQWETVNMFSSFIPQTAIFSHNFSATEAFRMFELRVPFGELPQSGRVPLGGPRVPENIRLEPTAEANTFELFAAGDIAVGYINKQQSQEAFSRDNSGKLWWKSGELVSVDSETGEYFHFGRKDSLVKVNDHNVHLDEIERLIQSHPAVKMAAVIPVTVADRIRIVAFVSWIDGSPPSHVAILEHLSGSLPSYAMPQHIIDLVEFPITRTGKMDRGALAKIASDRFA